jgi:hypothetical protein
MMKPNMRRKEIRPKVGSWSSRAWACGNRRNRFLRKAFGRIALFMFSLSALFISWRPVYADPGKVAEEKARPLKSYLVSLEYGWPA